MERLRQIVEGRETAAGRTFALSIQALIVLSLVAFSVETLPDLGEETRRYLGWFEVISVLIFTVEYLLRIVVTQKKLGYILSFYGLVDLVAILPFYLSLGIDLRSLRILRLLRLFRILKLMRYSRSIHRLRVAFGLAREELILFFSAALLCMFLSSVGIYYFENEAQPEVFSSVFHSLWWSVATLTTVGYGDIFPVTIGGKIFTFVVLMIGLGIVAVPSGMMASALSEARRREVEEAAAAGELPRDPTNGSPSREDSTGVTTARGDA